MINKTLLVCLLSVGFLSGCASMFARTSPASPSRATGENPPQRGLQITEVFKGSPAEAAGLRWPDVITKYGEFEIVDDATFFAARNHYKAAGTPTVEIIVWRGSTRMSAQVRTGWLGVQSRDYDNTSQKFVSMMTEINSMRELPQYLIDKGIYRFSGSESQILLNAKALVDQAERDGKLTPAQVLLYRIYLIPDDAPAEDQQRLEDLLQQLIASQPKNYIEHVGSDRFFKDKHYRAAIACFKEHLKRKSDDVSIRLNLGFAYNELGMYSEATSAADYVFEHRLELSDYGQVVAYTVKGKAALGLKDYPAGIEYGRKAFTIEPAFYTISLVQLAAAETGNLVLLDEATAQFRDTLPQKYAQKRVQSDAVKAYALMKANQGDAARKIVKAWKQVADAEGKVIDYWRLVPGGTEVSKTFGVLMKS